MNKDRIIEMLVEENKYFRLKHERAELEIKLLKNQLTYLRGRGRSTKVKRLTLERDNNQCVKCGSYNDLHVHHIIPLAKGGADELENTETLCLDCHIEAHEGESAATFLASHKK